MMVWVISPKDGMATGVCPECLAVVGPADQGHIDALDGHHAGHCPGRPPAGLSASARKRAERLLRGDY